MKYTEIKSHIKKDISTFLKAFGYKYNKDASMFIKPTTNGFWSVGPATVDYNPLFKMSFVNLIRIDEVEDVFTKFTAVRPDFEKYVTTLIIPYDLFKEAKNFYYHFYNIDELDFILKDFKKVFEEKIIPALEKFSDVNYLANMISTGEISKIDISNKPNNYMHWLIIAKLAGLSNLKSLSDSYFGDFFSTWKVESDIKRVTDLIEYIST